VILVLHNRITINLKAIHTEGYLNELKTPGILNASLHLKVLQDQFEYKNRGLLSSPFSLGLKDILYYSIYDH